MGDLVHKTEQGIRLAKVIIEVTSFGQLGVELEYVLKRLWIAEMELKLNVSGVA